MTIKIPVEKTEYCNDDGEELDGVIVRADIWRKIMPVLRAVNAWYVKPILDPTLDDNLSAAFGALEKHLERKP